MVRAFLIVFAFAAGLAVTAQMVSAQEAVSCDDFDYQEEAQAVLDADPGDEHGLDPDGNGIACEELPSSADGTADPTSTPDTTSEADDTTGEAADTTLPTTGTEYSASSGTPAIWMFGLAALGATLLVSAFAFQRREN